jgi:hypothetical protein
MPTQPSLLQTVNSRGIPVRRLNVISANRVTELHLQKFGDVWVPFKWVVRRIH